MNNNKLQTPPLPLPYMGGECHAALSHAVATPLPSARPLVGACYQRDARRGGAGVGSVTLAHSDVKGK